MAIVTEISWDDMLDGKPLPETPARQAWRNAVAEVADKAKGKLPECNGRVDKAVALVLAGAVELLADGTAKVASQSNSSMAYHIVKGHCDCRDFEKAPHQFCKHRLSAAIARRAQELTTATPADTNGHAEPPSQLTPAQPAPATPLPEAPASVNVHLEVDGRQVQLTLRDSDEGRLLARLDAILQRFPLVGKPTDTRARPDGWCSKHGVQMTQNHKDGRSWYSHKTAEGWCKGK